MFRGSLIDIRMRAKTATVNMTFTGLSQEGPHVGVLNHFPKISTPPLSLSMARTEPVRVIHPTNAERPAATTTTCNVNPVGKARLASSIYFQDSESATKAEAAPPKPLKSATNSGIPVISTLIAMTRPMMEPMTIPAMMSSHSTPPVEENCMSTMVVMTATNIPNAPYWFPRGAVRGWPSFFRPKMNSAADSK